jgi:hypothetical protein
MTNVDLDFETSVTLAKAGDALNRYANEYGHEDLDAVDKMRQLARDLSQLASGQLTLS